MAGRAPFLNSRLQGYTGTIFSEMSALALATDSINLGQGFPDTDGPESMKAAAIQAIRDGHNQYPPLMGIAPLREAIAWHQQTYRGLSFDPESEILVTAGATEAIAASLLALLEVGDEVVMFEPYYDSYAACVAMAGASRRVVTLEAPDWHFDPDAFNAAITDRTRLVLLNTPHNPTGKVFGRAELEMIAAACQEHDLLVVTDEVYEHLVYEAEHISIASLSGMAERTVTISSAAKTFSVTGWKVGWACAPAPLVAAVRAAKQFLTFVNAGPFQYAIAQALREGETYMKQAGEELRQKRDLLAAGLAAAGFEVFETRGTFFLTTDAAPLGATDGYEFCRSLPERCRVVAIPSSVFYDNKDAGRTLVRWTFCKRTEVLDEACARLLTLRN